LSGTRCCWRRKWASRSSYPREQTNKDTLTRMQKAHAHTHAVPRSSCPRETHDSENPKLPTSAVA
jgi:hypothetical protein